MTDSTKRFQGMIERLENDFVLAADPENKHGLDELQFKIEAGDKRLLKDIELLKELSSKIRYGQIAIREYRNQAELEEDCYENGLCRESRLCTVNDSRCLFKKMRHKIKNFVLFGLFVL